MRNHEANTICLHEDTAVFRESLNFTSAKTGFPPRLIERDYFSTIMLAYLTAADDRLVFKGGTCLAKVHAGFYRMSEDLDFAVPTAADAPRKERRLRTAGLKDAVADLKQYLPAFHVSQPLTGANNSTQYVAIVQYASLIARQPENIKLEIGLREPLLTPVLRAPARTMLLNPASGEPSVTPITVNSLSLLESFAEKFRAALSRREGAIRDFYDIDYAVRKMDLNPTNARLVKLVRQKMAVPGNKKIDVSPNRLESLQRQIESQLKPVLRAKDFAEFDLDRAFATVVQVAATIGNAV